MARIALLIVTFAFVLLVGIPTESGAQGAQACSTATEPQTPTYIQALFYPVKPRGLNTLRRRDLEFQWDAQYDLPGTLGLSETDQRTLDRLGITYAQLPGHNPLGANLWSGVVLSGAGLAVRIVAMTRLGSRFSPLLAVQREHALETGGLYARIRHPGYLGALLATLGGALAFGSALVLPLVAAMGLLLWARAGREEVMLERHFGDAYRGYLARSGRFLPRFGPTMDA